MDGDLGRGEPLEPADDETAGKVVVEELTNQAVFGVTGARAGY
ncbi:MAG TPA: hypothetical protein VJ347_07010 [Streptosporangiaceae bacterium]|jgi:hypothetical protein|nr:hypothetical protein [Streptosporangiaceae bacterium]